MLAICQLLHKTHLPVGVIKGRVFFHKTRRFHFVLLTRNDFGCISAKHEQFLKKDDPLAFLWFGEQVVVILAHRSQSIKRILYLTRLYSYWAQKESSYPYVSVVEGMYSPFYYVLDYEEFFLLFCVRIGHIIHYIQCAWNHGPYYEIFRFS